MATDDLPWEDEFASGDPTVIDEAAPISDSSRDSTGKHRTLPGFADAIEQTREHYLAMGEIRGLKKACVALKLIRISLGDHPSAADVVVEKFKKWMTENEELIHVAMDGEQ